MTKHKHIIASLITAATLSFGVLPALATVTVPVDGISSHNSMFIEYLPICENGALVIIQTGITLVLLYSYVPVSPIQPAMKLWGPIPYSDAKGNFYWGGVCLLPPYSTPMTVDGTIIQLGTTLLPVPDALYPYIFMW